jgi:hypothetical protein
MSLLRTLSLDFRPVRATNTTDNGFPSRAMTASEPTGIGDSTSQNIASTGAAAVFDLGGGVVTDHNRAVFKLFGAGADNSTFSMRVIGWRRVYGRTGNDPNKLLWDPTVLVEVLATLSSTPTGVAGRAVLNTDLFADTVALTGTTANDDVSIDIVSPANDTAAHFVIDLKGSAKLEATFSTGGSATSCNALVACY